MRVGPRRDAHRPHLPPRAASHPVAHLPGQHYVVRLTAQDGYTASRSYSVASAPDDSRRDRAHRRAAGRRRGVALPARRGRAGRRARGAGPARGLVRLGRRLAGAARRRRLGRGAADGDAPRRPGRPAGPTSCASSCRCARPTTSTTPPSCPAPRSRSSTPAWPPPATPGPPAGSPPPTSGPVAGRAPRSTCAARAASSSTPRRCCSTSGVDPADIRVERFGPS